MWSLKSAQCGVDTHFFEAVTTKRLCMCGQHGPYVGNLLSKMELCSLADTLGLSPNGMDWNKIILLWCVQERTWSKLDRAVAKLVCSNFLPKIQNQLKFEPSMQLPVAYKTGNAQKELRVDQQTGLSILDPGRMWLLHKGKYFDGMISPADACVMRISRLELAPGIIEMRQDSGGSSIYIPLFVFCIRRITWDWMFRCAPDATLLAQWATVRIIINCSPDN